jgi:hypothetical protein
MTKHPSFREEREYRLVSEVIHSGHKTPVYVRATESFLIPFVEIKLGDLGKLVREVTIGPTPHFNVIFDAALTFLSNAGANVNGSIRESVVPFRPS